MCDECQKDTAGLLQEKGETLCMRFCLESLNEMEPSNSAYSGGASTVTAALLLDPEITYRAWLPYIVIVVGVRVSVIPVYLKQHHTRDIQT